MLGSVDAKCGEQKQTNANCSQHDKPTKIDIDICGVSLSYISTVSYTIIILISLFKMFFSLVVASCVMPCLLLYSPPFLLLTLTSLHFLPPFPLKFSLLLLFPHFLFSPSPIVTVVLPSPCSPPLSPDLFQFTLCY